MLIIASFLLSLPTGDLSVFQLKTMTRKSELWRVHLKVRVCFFFIFFENESGAEGGEGEEEARNVTS